VSWKLFEAAAPTYEGWYATRRGQRVERAERALLAWLLRSFPNVRDALDIGCGTGHFTEWFAAMGLPTTGLDRSPAMLAELHRRLPHMPILYGNAHQLPVRAAAVDVVAFVTTSLRTILTAAAGERLREIRWASTLFPDGVWKLRARIPLGDVIGMAARLAPPAGAVSVVPPGHPTTRS
jgi:ubiquinone/menaquinone biosynthesis C-methylase UbiE